MKQFALLQIPNYFIRNAGKSQHTYPNIVQRYCVIPSLQYHVEVKDSTNRDAAPVGTRSRRSRDALPTAARLRRNPLAFIIDPVPQHLSYAASSLYLERPLGCCGTWTPAVAMTSRWLINSANHFKINHFCLSILGVKLNLAMLVQRDASRRRRASFISDSEIR